MEGEFAQTLSLVEDFDRYIRIVDVSRTTIGRVIAVEELLPPSASPDFDLPVEAGNGRHVEQHDHVIAFGMSLPDKRHDGFGPMTQV
jgi:hypothetical protein